MKITKFEELNIWKDSLNITKEIYDLTAKGNWSKDSGLRDQIRKTIISVSSNIVEGFEKNNNNEFGRFLKIAKGSIGEARNQLYIALAVNYISQEEFDRMNKKLEDLAAQAGGLISYLVNKKKAQLAKLVMVRQAHHLLNIPSVVEGLAKLDNLLTTSHELNVAINTLYANAFA